MSDHYPGYDVLARRHTQSWVDFAMVGTGAGGGTLACRLAEKGSSVIGFDAGAWWRPLEEFVSGETAKASVAPHRE